MYRMAARRIFITILLLSINIVSFYMVDMVGTSYFSDKYAIDGMANMFYENPECVNYIKVVGTSRTSAAAQTISDYVRTVDDIKYCGYFNDGAATDLIEGETVHVVISDPNTLFPFSSLFRFLRYADSLHKCFYSINNSEARYFSFHTKNIISDTGNFCKGLIYSDGHKSGTVTAWHCNSPRLCYLTGIVRSPITTAEILSGSITSRHNISKC